MLFKFPTIFLNDILKSVVGIITALMCKKSKILKKKGFK